MLARPHPRRGAPASLRAPAQRISDAVPRGSGRALADGVSVQAQVVNLLADLRATMRLTLLFIAHDLSMIRHVSDRMAVMYLGRIVELGPTDDVFFRPAHPCTQALVAANPVPHPVPERRREPPRARGEIPAPANLGSGCRFAERCPLAMPVCRERDPAPFAVGGRRAVACHLHDPAVAQPTPPGPGLPGQGASPPRS